MARPKKSTIKECILHIRIDKKTLQQLERVSKKNNITKANFVRHCIEYACGQTDIVVSPQLTEENIMILNLLASLNGCLNTLILQTKKIGTNINQIARYNNSYTITTGQSLVEETIQELQNIKSRTSILAEGLEVR